MLQSTYPVLRESTLLKKTLSILQANRLYLATMLLVISLGGILQSLSFSWGLILTEIVLILLPTLWLLKHNQINLRESASLQKTRASLLLVASMLGGGAWLVTSLVEQLMVQITGYIPPTPEGMLPTTIFQAVLVFIGLVFAAPICEEILFRGTIQTAYQKHTTGGVAVLIVSLLFAFYHFRLQGLPALLLISFLLGYTYWRTQSLTFTILLHAANNFLAATVLIAAGLFPDRTLPFPSLQAGAFGIMMLVAGLVLLQRLIPHAPSRDEKEYEPVKLFTWKVWWPILLAGVLFIVVAFQEVTQAKQNSALPLDGQPLPVSAQWTYDIQHKGGEKIGESICQWHQGEVDSNLSCEWAYAGFEYQEETSFYSSLANLTSFTVEWQTDNLQLVSLSQKNSNEVFENNWLVNKIGSDLELSIQSENIAQDKITFMPQTLIEEEWSWRMMGLSFEPGRTYTVEYLVPLTWRARTQDNGPLLKKERLTISGPENIIVPAGEFQAWKVSLSNGQTAWYSVEQPTILLRFDSTMVNYMLAEAN